MGDMKQDNQGTQGNQGNQGQQSGGNQATNREPAEGGREQSQGQQGGGAANRPQGQDDQKKTDNR